MKKTGLIILSIAFNFHDSNVALSIDNKIIASLELERLFRTKKINASIDQMEIASKYLLERFKLSVLDIDYLVVNALNNPFEESINSNDIYKRTYNFLGRKLNTFVVRHHFAHAGHYLFSPFSKSLIVSCDGGGDLGERVAYFLGSGNKIKRLNIDTNKHTSTKPYGQFSSYLYGEAFSEGKLMGLAGIGKVEKKILYKVSRLFNKLRNVNFITGQSIIGKVFKKEKGLAKKDYRKCYSLAACIQYEFLRRRLKDIKKVYRQDYKSIVLVGGSTLNLECNTNIYNKISQNIYTSPNCDDTGIAIGQCAVVISHLLDKRPICDLPFIGLNESKKSFGITHKKISKFIEENNPKKIAKRLANNEICLCHIGRPEVGPRALGHRSFLMSPIKCANRDIISSEVKQRESYRPIAPIILEEDLSLFFSGGPNKSPYMLFEYEANERAKKQIPAVVHFDDTSRVQTISIKSNPFVYEILKEFKKLTSIGVLINTSLNLKGQPLSNSLHDTLEIARKIHTKIFLTVNYK